jgi:hypothetical protein
LELFGIVENQFAAPRNSADKHKRKLMKIKLSSSIEHEDAHPILTPKNHLAAPRKHSDRHTRKRLFHLRSSCVWVLGLLVSAFLSHSVQAQQDMLWLTGNNLGTVNLNINGNPATYDADGLDIYLTDINNQNPPRVDDTYSLSFMTGGSAFMDIEDKTYEAANPGPNANAEDLLTATITDVSVSPDIFNNSFMDLSFYGSYGPNNLPADVKTFLGANQAVGYVSLDYDPNNNNQINTIYASLTAVPEPSPAILIGAGIVCLTVGRRLLAIIPPIRSSS